MNWRMRYGRNWGQLGMKYNVNIKKLSEVADLTVGFVGSMAKHYVDEGVPFLRSTNIRRFKIDMSDIKYISPEFNEKIKKSQLREGDVVIVRTGMPGACTVILKEQEGWNCSDLVIIHPHKEKVLPLYIAAYVNYSTGIINANLVGAVQQHFNVGSAKNMEIAVPSIEIQKKIVGIIQNINEKLDINSRINKNLEQQAEALFHSLFIENANPTWKDGVLSDLGTVVAGGTPSKTKPEYYSEQGIAWITPKDLSLNKSKFISRGEIDISELGFSKSSATKMPTGTVLFSSRAPIGYIAIATNEVTTNQGFKSVVPNENVGTAFMYYLLKFLLPTIEGMASGSTFKEISGTGMKSVPVVIPDNETIEKFNAFCTPIFQQQEVLEAENSRLADIRDALLPKLMSGQLDVSNIEL